MYKKDNELRCWIGIDLIHWQKVPPTPGIVPALHLLA